MATVAEIPSDKLLVLASYLDEFSPPSNKYEDDSEPYWYLLAVTLRKLNTLGEDYQYDEHKLTRITGMKNSAEVFLKLLVEKKLEFEVFISCLKTIKCQKALNMFTRASTPIIKGQSVEGEITVGHGGTITMSVTSECLPGPPVYQWFKDQKNIIPGQTTKTLFLFNASTNDTGYYHCRVTNPKINDPAKRSAFSKYVHITVTPPPTVNHHPTVRQEMGSTTPTPSHFPHVTLHPSPITAVAGERVKLECEAELAVCYDWYKNRELIKSQAPTGVLLIESFSADDAGDYMCEVVNDHGRKQSKTVRVQLGRSLVSVQEASGQSESMIVFEEEPPETQDVHVGEDIVLTCQAKSLNGEPIKYNWVQVEKSGKEKVDADQGPKFNAKTDNIERRLKIKVYCRASLVNNPQVVSQSRATKVTINTVWFTKQPQSIERAWIGNKATLNCSAEGVGEIVYTWFKASTKEGIFRPIKKLMNQPKTVLYFKRLRQEDWGYYQCQAGNTSQFVTSNTVCVRPTIPTMKRSSSFRVPLIRITKNPWSQIIPEGGKFRLLCEAACTKEIPLGYQWYHNDKKIHGATEFTYERQETEASDCGEYFCEVTCIDNPGVKSENSKLARIELAADNGEGKPLAIGSSYAQKTQTQGEEVFLTKSEERYAREKIALLIGNQNYECEDLNNLQSPEYDIKELRTLLEDVLDFKVISLLDLTHSEMMRALEFFYEMLAIPGVYALFYYSGHGFATMNKNFLIPVNATLPLRAETNICADGICKQMRKKLSRAVLVLDCCRVQPSAEESLSSLDLSSLESEAGDEPINIANFVQILSCQEGNVAYEGRKLSSTTTPTHQLSLSPVPRYPCSNFNIAFREALGAKKKFTDVFRDVMKKLGDLESLQNRAGMRPIITQSLRDDEITLHDNVFMDNSEHEPKLEKIRKLHEEVHYVPDPVIMDSPEEIGELSGLAVLELSFSYDFTNVLYVHTQLHLLNRDKTTKARLEYDISFLERQGVCADQDQCSFDSPLDDSDMWGQGESPQLVSTKIRISSIQKLQSYVLKLLITLSLHTEGRQIRTKVEYKLPKKPLFANLQ